MDIGEWISMLPLWAVFVLTLAICIGAVELGAALEGGRSGWTAAPRLDCGRALHSVVERNDRCSLDASPGGSRESTASRPLGDTVSGHHADHDWSRLSRRALKIEAVACHSGAGVDLFGHHDAGGRSRPSPGGAFDGESTVHDRSPKHDERRSLNRTFNRWQKP